MKLPHNTYPMNASPSNYPQYYNPPDEDSLDVKRYLSLFMSNWYWFALSLFISISIAYGINRWSEKIYTVSSTLLIKDDPNVALIGIFPGSDGFRSQQKVNNEIGILKSFDLHHRVMKELPEFSIIYTSVGKRGIAETRMYNNAPFLVVLDSLQSQKTGKKIEIHLLSDKGYQIKLNGANDIEKDLRFGEQFNEEGFNFIINLRNPETFKYDPDASNKFYFYFSDPASLANSYRNKLSVSPIEEEASLVILTTTGYVPQQEADYLNKLMDVYLEYGLEYKNKTADQTIDFIEEQLKTISASLKIAEGELESFRLDNRLIDISREGTIIQNKLEEIDAERTRLIMQKNYYEYLKDYIDLKRENTDIISPSVMGVTDPLLIRLVGDLGELQKQKRQLSINLYETSEPLRIIENNIGIARKAIIENISDGLLNIEKWISDTDVRLSVVEKEIRKLPSTEREMINIQRQFDINNTVYTFLLEKRAEAGISRASNVADNRIIDKAGYYSSSRIRPKSRQNLMIALVLGLTVPLFLMMIIDYLNTKIIDRKDIEKVTAIPIMGYISHNTLQTELPVIEKPGSALSESFRSVRTNLKYFLKDAECPVISVSSTITAEGKTFASANLSAILAMSGKRVLLIGLDLRKPRIHRIFGINNEVGITDFLIRETRFEDIIVETGFENLWYAPSGPVPPNPAELIESAAMTELIELAKKKFDYIVIDTPPVAIVTDALLVSRFTDFYLFVVRQRYSSKNTLELIDELYKNGTLKNVGLVINDISISGYYGYGLRYGYSMGYGYNYGYNYYSQYGKYGYADSAKRYYTDEG
jgi:tyrosine-protein kinase Etk/Wzc